MRAAFVTILPMLAAAVLVMVGGERMARREVENRTLADRERLLDLAAPFREELARLDGLYLDHLDRITGLALGAPSEQAASAAWGVEGIRLIRIFRPQGKDVTISKPLESGTLPEIEIRDRKRIFNPSTAIVLEREWLEEGLPPDKDWLEAPRSAMRVRLFQPVSGTLVAILVDIPHVRKITAAHLTEWLAEPLVPLQEAGERVQIDAPSDAALVSIGPARHGPAASVMPIRNLTGDWQIRSWDGIVVSHSHDATTLILASTVALALVGSGILLHSQQKRALKLAAERVSFVNRVSHELGTPLTNLSLNLDLATEALSQRPADARHRLGIVAEEIERLSRLVANVLTFSRRERDTLQLKPVRCVPGEVVARTLESFRPALERRTIGIEAEIAAAEPVLLDPDALSQITGNLLSNVEKYAVAGRWLRLDCRLGSGMLTLEVRDRGPGIPANARERIFTAFERVLHTTNEGASGTGLGLTIGRDLARRMGGTLELLECPQGAAFRLRIPAPPALALFPSTTDAA